MKAKVGDVVVPGDTVEEAETIAKQNKKVILGPGLRFEGKFELLKVLQLKFYIKVLLIFR